MIVCVYVNRYVVALYVTVVTLIRYLCSKQYQQLTDMPSHTRLAFPPAIKLLHASQFCHILSHFLLRNSGKFCLPCASSGLKIHKMHDGLGSALEPTAGAYSIAPA